MQRPTSEDLATACEADGEFRLAARFWNGGFRLRFGDHVAAVRLDAGTPRAGDPGDGPGVITLEAPDGTWESLIAETPPRFLNDVLPARVFGGLIVEGDELLFAQYYPAIARAIELLRPTTETAEPAPSEPGELPRFDSPLGRYVHVELEGQDHRIYFEEAGSGIPLLLQHTAGSHGSQWRHLFERREITDHFRLIAYDLPFHGKSVPPVGPRWWTERYALRGPFLRSLPVKLGEALALDEPAFMGCSVGGLLALDLARHHPDVFRAVISVEGALAVPGTTDGLEALWHPQVSNEYKARFMDGLMAPASPEAYRRETTALYAAGWPPAFLGDLHYYLDEFDLTKEAEKIDTRACGVHILSGEYDWSAPLELGRAAHEAIPGSTFTPMPGLGHFPMSENPDAFVEHLQPVLEAIRNA